jgi:hypothetical protein
MRLELAGITALGLLLGGLQAQAASTSRVRPKHHHCGHSCPDGSHAESYTHDSACSGSDDEANASKCVANTKESIEVCGEFCPFGYDEDHSAARPEPSAACGERKGEPGPRLRCVKL